MSTNPEESDRRFANTNLTSHEALHGTIHHQNNSSAGSTTTKSNASDMMDWGQRTDLEWKAAEQEKKNKWLGPFDRPEASIPSQGMTKCLSKWGKIKGPQLKKMISPIISSSLVNRHNCHNCHNCHNWHNCHNRKYNSLCTNGPNGVKLNRTSFPNWRQADPSTKLPNQCPPPHLKSTIPT